MKASFRCSVGLLVALASVSWAEAARAQLVVQSVPNVSPATAAQLASQIAAPGVSISNASLSGAAGAIGSFSGGSSVVGFDLNQGVLVSSGSASNAVGPNDDDGAVISTGDWHNAGDLELEAALGILSGDAASLSFDFSCPLGSNVVKVDYVFGSEEWDELDRFDGMAIFVDGVNAATLPGGDPVRIDLLSLQAAIFRDNTLCDIESGCPFDLQADGFSTKLTATKPIGPGVHHFDLVVADEMLGETDDRTYDSWAFVSSLACARAGTTAAPMLGQRGAWGLGAALVLLTGLSCGRALRRRSPVRRARV